MFGPDRKWWSVALLSLLLLLTAGEGRAATYRLMLEASPRLGGSFRIGSSTASETTLDEGGSVSVTAQPAAGFIFRGWRDDTGAEVSATAQFTYTMPGRDVTLTATFEYDPENPGLPDEPVIPDPPVVPEKAEVTFSALPPLGGTVSPSGTQTYDVGTSVSVKASANAGFRFLNWTDAEGTEISTSANFSYTVTEGAQTLTAHFEYDPENPGVPDEPVIPDPPAVPEKAEVTFSAQPALGGTVSPNGTQTYDVGAGVSVSATANAGFRFLNWTDAEGTEIAATANVSYTVTEGPQTLTANFEYDPENPGVPDEPVITPPEEHTYVTMSFSANPPLGGSTTPSGSGEQEVGKSISVSATPNPGFRFLNWTDALGNEVSAASGFSHLVTEDGGDFTANFEYDPENPGLPDEPVIDDSLTPNTVRRPRFCTEPDGKVAIMCDTEGAAIHYTLDESEPTVASALYTAPFSAPYFAKVRAIALKDGMTASPMQDYRVGGMTCKAPEIAIKKQKIAISTVVPGGTIHYTVDGTAPTVDNEVFTTPFLPDEDCIVRAMVSAESLNDSEITNFAYTKPEWTMKEPTFSWDRNNRLMTLVCPSRNAIIRYTLDGSDPTGAGTVYTGPFQIDSKCTVRAIATHEDWFPSQVSAFEVTAFNEYSLTFMLKNPDGTESVYSQSAVEYNSPITLPETPALTGYTFNGWQGLPENMLMPANDLTVTGDFTVNKYTVTFDIDGVITTAQFDYGTEIVLPDMPEKTGYTFGGWMGYPEGGLMPARDIYITAMFIANSYMVTFDIDGVITTEYFDYGTEIILPEDPVKEGYTFVGWEGIPEDGLMTADDVTITAIFTVNSYTVTFVVDGETSTAQFDYGSEIILPEAPVKTGFTFIGWEGLPEDGLMPARDITLTAVFDINSYTLRFDIVDEEGTLVKNISTASVAYGDPITEPDPQTPVGYVFSGWEGMPENGRMPAHDVTVTGQYILNTFTASFIIESEGYRQDIQVIYGEEIVPPTPPAKEYHDFLGWTGLPEDMLMPNHDITIYGEYQIWDQATLSTAYDGRTLTVNSPTPGAEVRITGSVETGRGTESVGTTGNDGVSVDALGVGTILVEVTADHYRPATEDVPVLFYGNEERAVISKPGILASAYGWNGGKVPEADYFELYGPVDASDIELAESEQSNPNRLVYAPSAGTVIDSAHKNVIYDDGEGRTCNSLELQDEQSFSTGVDFTAKDAVFYKEFNQESGVNRSSGWYSLVLPFSCSGFVHTETGNRIMPFPHDYDRLDIGYFWLYSHNGTDWKAEESIEAGKPYIISMPNSEYYNPICNITGTVEFRASDALVDPSLFTEEPVEGFNPTFNGVEASTQVLALNSEDSNRYVDGKRVPAGSHFIADYRHVRPFEGYFYSTASRSYVAIFPGTSGVGRMPTSHDPTSHDGDVTVRVENGTIHVDVARDTTVRVMDATGLLLNEQPAQAGETLSIPGLPHGLYLVNGVKVRL